MAYPCHISRRCYRRRPHTTGGGGTTALHDRAARYHGSTSGSDVELAYAGIGAFPESDPTMSTTMPGVATPFVRRWPRGWSRD